MASRQPLQSPTVHCTWELPCRGLGRRRSLSHERPLRDMSVLLHSSTNPRLPKIPALEQAADETRSPCQPIGCISSCVQTSRVRMFLQPCHDGVGDRWVTLSDHWQTVGQARPIGAQTRSHSTWSPTHQAQEVSSRPQWRELDLWAHQATDTNSATDPDHVLWQTRLTTEVEEHWSSMCPSLPHNATNLHV